MKKKSNNGLIIGILVVVIAIAGAVALTGGKKDSKSTSSGSSSSTSSASTQDAVAANTVTIKDYAFAAPAIKVKVGTTVTWTNMDDVEHNIVADKSSSDAPNGPLLAKGKTYSFTFNKAGTYAYHCMPHPYMHGTVIVE